eukprot:165970-Amorphochlora_amoeboformis.AAC.1
MIFHGLGVDEKRVARRTVTLTLRTKGVGYLGLGSSSDSLLRVKEVVGYPTRSSRVRRTGNGKMGWNADGREAMAGGYMRVLIHVLDAESDLY